MIRYQQLWSTLTYLVRLDIVTSIAIALALLMVLAGR